MSEFKIGARRIISPQADMSDPATVDAEFNTVAARSVQTTEELVTFIDHWMEVNECVGEYQTRFYTTMTCNTADTEAEGNYLQMVEKISPIMAKRNFELKKQLVESPAVDQLSADYDVFLREARNEIDLFREENVPLQTENTKLAQKYQKITGAWMVEWEGEKQTVHKVKALLEETDRELRHKAFMASEKPHLADVDALNDLYDDMLNLRRTIARNAGFDNYRDYMFRSYGRFDYTPEDCFAFHAAIKEHVVPLVTEIMEQRKADMGVDALRPWDLQADPKGLPPVRPFTTTDQLIAKVGDVLHQVNGELGGYFDIMVEHGLLDLDSREGKAPGGYMADFTERKLPFIFMNSVGTQRNVDTLLHESGHAFHLFLARDLKPSSYMGAPMEFAEVASMSMELLARPYFDRIYEADELKRVKDNQLVGVVKFLPFMVCIDAFQHWVYTNPSTAETRGDYWAALMDEYLPHIDWSGLEEYKRKGWQYLHVFQVPFYYIEYGIAQLGALQVWQNSLNDYSDAVRQYKKGLALGGSQPLPTLFKTAGGVFDMTEATLKPLMSHIAGELKK